MTELINYSNESILPNDNLTEKFILSRMLEGKEIGTIALILKAEDFYSERHQLIYSACINIFIEGHNIDLVSCRQELIRLGKMEQAGGLPYLFEIQNYFSPGELEIMCLIVRDYSTKRKLIKLTCDVLKEVKNNSINGYDLLADTLLELEKIQESLYTKGSRDIKTTTNDVIERIGTSTMIGFTTGFKELDDVTNGILQPDLTVIAAGPGEGKSLLALNIAESMAKQGHAGMFFSLEMKQNQLVERLISKRTGYSVLEIRKGEYWCSDEKKKKAISKDYVFSKTNDIGNLPIYFQDNGLNSYTDIGSIVKAELVRKKIKWIVVDYLQLVPVPSNKGQSRDLEIGKITRYLKLLAMQLRIPIIILSQVNRQKGRTRYKLSDLRESGNIEQDADNVIFIYRPELHGLCMYEVEGFQIVVDENTAVLQIAKNRAGELKDIVVKFYGKTSQFMSMEDVDNTPQTTNNDLPF